MAAKRYQTLILDAGTIEKPVDIKKSIKAIEDTFWIEHEPSILFYP